MVSQIATIVWDHENEFVRFEGGLGDVGDHVWDGGTTLAAIIMNGLAKLDEPIFLHPQTAVELAKARIIESFGSVYGGPPLTADFDGVTVHLYMGPL